MPKKSTHEQCLRDHDSSFWLIFMKEKSDVVAAIKLNFLKVIFYTLIVTEIVAICTEALMFF